ncbi:MAG: ZIP family metal transporter [Alphaproteobacteria bacterium]
MTTMIIQGTLAALFTSLFAGLGGFLVFFKKNYSKSNINFLLNAAAGIMLASSFFTLLVPAAGTVVSMPMGKYWGALLLVVSVLAGVGIVWILHAVLPHEHEISGHHGLQMDLRSSWLFVIAIAIHKFPEGLAVGVAYAGERLYNPESLAIGIGLQNIPEGLMVSVTLMAIGFSRLKAALFAAVTGLMQPFGALIGVIGTGWSMAFVPFGMAMAGGTMLFVIINEIIPETYANKENEKHTMAIMLGFVMMMFMSIVLG